MSANRNETEFDRFKELARKILKVSKSEIEGRPNVGTRRKKGIGNVSWLRDLGPGP